MSEQVTVLLLTYNRLKYAETTLRAALDNIKTTRSLSVHIASDGDTDDYIEHLRHIAGGYANVTGVGHTNAERRGYGANFNLATQVVHQHSKYVLPLEDDWKLTRNLELDPLVEVLDNCHSIDCIRMGYLGFTQNLCGCVERYNGLHFLILHPFSDEPHVFAGHPRLETVDFERKVGPWPEGLLPGATEVAVSRLPAARKGIAWPLDLVPANGGLFEHIGTERAY